MLAVGIGQAEDIDTLSATKMAIKKAKENLGEYFPQAGIVFAGQDFQHEQMLAEINQEFPNINLIGCTTAGEITSDLGFSDDSVVLLLFYSDEVKFSIGMGNLSGDENSQNSAKRALSDARQSLSQKEKLCIVFTDSFLLSANEVIQTINSNVEKDCKVFGGVSARPFGTDFPLKVFYKDKVYIHSVVLLLMSEPIQYSFSLSNTWKPIGRKALATKVEGKNLLEIDGIRAIDYYHYYLGDYSFPAPEFPLAVYENHSENFYLRVPGGYDKKKGSVLFAGEIPEGATVQLTEAVRNYIVEDLADTSGKSLESKEKFTPVLAFAFSCIMRKHILGTQVQEEIQILQKTLPDNLPIFGFYTFGEIAPVDKNSDDSYLHNCTMITLVIGTSSNSILNEKKINVQNEVQETKESESKLIENLKRENLFLQKKLEREVYYRKNLENVKDFHGSIMKTINQEIEAAKQVIQVKNQELEKLYKELGTEKKKSDDLLLNILPHEVANELKAKGLVEPIFYESASVLFTDFKGFTTIAGKMKPSELVKELDFYFSEFDRIIERYGLEKLKTIGDAYMCAGGLPKVTSDHAISLVSAGIDIRNFINELKQKKESSSWDIRIGINSGPLMAGVIGKKKFSYDVWGDTVNIASRLESNSEPGKINISQYTYNLVKDFFDCEYRGKIAVKNKGEIDMYFVIGKKS